MDGVEEWNLCCESTLHYPRAREGSSFLNGCYFESSVSSKMSFFAWEVTLGKELTLDQLQRGGWSSTNRCFLCQNEED